tara:strand:+ start:16789 stop:17904 length:1116 start_codon:yes stop_codon:yes gene_type:complete
MDIEENLSTNKFHSSILKHGGNVFQEAYRLGIKANDFLDASASLVPFPPPRELQQHLINALQDSTLKSYPDRTHLDLKQAIATWHHVDPDMVFPGNGAAEVNTWSARDASFLGVSGLPSPGFSDYERALRCWEGSFIHIPLQLIWNSNFPQAFSLTSNVKVIWVTNPHNPTGQLWSRHSLEPLLDKYSLVICDEAFLPLVPNGEQESLIPLIEKHRNLIVIRSLTKLFAIPGLRIGYAISQAERLQKWYEWRDPWPLNGLAITAGTMLLNNQKLMGSQISKVQNWIKQEGPWLHSKLNSLPKIIAYPSSTNFQLIQSNEPLLELREKLAQQKILVRDCRSFFNLGANWLRISLQTRSNNKRIFLSIQKILK